MNLATQLKAPCEVCGCRVLLVQPMNSQPEGAAVYMCENCKAVYRPNGVRDARYPSLYDAEPGPSFDAMHAQLTGMDKTASVPMASSSTHSWALAQFHRQDRLLQVGLVAGDPLQVRRHHGWTYASAYDYNAATNMVSAIVPGDSVAAWYTGANWRKSEQPLPIPVTAPPPPAAAKKTGPRRGDAGFIRLAAPIQARVFRVWTYGSKRGMRVGDAIAADLVLTADSLVTVALGRGVKGLKFNNPAQDLIHVFELTSGALLGTCTAGNHRAYADMLKQIRADIASSDAATLKLQLEGAKRRQAEAETLTESAFFSRNFELTTV